MNRQLRTFSWACLAILACFFMLYAILPRFCKQNGQKQDEALHWSNSVFDKVSNANLPVGVYPPAEEIIISPSQYDSVPRAVVAEPSAAILNDLSEPSALDDETTNSRSSASPTAEIASADKEQLRQKEEAILKEVVETSPALPEPSTEPQSIPELTSPTAEPTPSEKKAPTLVAHLPSTLNMPAEAAEPAPLDLRYPNTGLEPVEQRMPIDMEQSHSSRKELKSWTEPASLLSLLDELNRVKESAAWAAETAQLVRELGPAVESNSDDAASILDRLAKSGAEAVRLADAGADWPQARKLRQASYAIERRLEIWREVVRLGVSSLVEVDMPKVDPGRLSICLAEIDRLTKNSAEGQHWRKYLLVDAMKELASERPESETEQQRKVAQQVLARMTQTPMSTGQRKFIASKPVAAYCAELRRWAADPITSADVLRDIERYEQTRLPSDAQRLANDLRSLSQSSDPDRRELAGRVESHYRNANLRASLTEDFLNRLIPKQKTELAPVRDTVLGLPVRGQSMTSSDVALRLIPDPTRVRMALEVTGEVAAVTSSTSGPATFYNDSDSLYAARKPFEIDPKGVKLLPAEVDVRHQTRLRDVETDFDGIPLIGWMARNVARQQHELYSPQANQEARSKVADRARQRIDAEAQARMAEMVNNLNRNLFGPLVNMSLEPTMLEAQTTQQRMTMRLRVAGEDQLGSFSPRPQAPDNSLASFQINESMLNNSLQRLQLEGRTFTLPQLVRRISERFQRPEIWQIKPEYEDLTVTFAKKDAVTVQCQDGRVILTISIVELSKEPRQWNDFQVRVFYRPLANGRSAELARDGVVNLIGKQLNNNAQIALRGIFSKAFPKNETIKLTPERLLVDPKLEDLAITQFVIDDGWVGFAVGPKRYAMQISQLQLKIK